MTRIIKDGSNNFLTSKSGDLFSVVTDDTGIITNFPFSLQIDGDDVNFIASDIPEGAEFFHIEFNGFISGVYTSHRIKVNATGNGYIGTKEEVFGPFESELYDETNLAIEFERGIIAPVLRTSVSPLPPGKLTITGSTGTVDPGDIVITISSLPDGGDGNTYGDGLGEVDFIDVSINGGAWEVLTDSAATGDYTYNTSNPGVEVAVQGRARSSFRPGPASDIITITSKDYPVVVDPPVDLGLLTDQILSEGESFSIDLDDYVTGATRYVINTGLTGGSYNSTTHVYSVSSLSVETVTFRFTAYNGPLDTDPSISLQCDISVEESVIAPTLNPGGIDDVSVQVGETVLFNLASYFSGSAFTISLSPNDNATFGLGTGGQATYFKNKTALSSPFASTNFTVTATNSAGSASDTFAVQVVATREPKLTINTEVRVKYAVNRFGTTTYRAGVIDFPTNRDVITGKTVKPVWSTGNPDANGIITPENYEYLEKTSDSPKEYQTQMDQPLARGNPDDQVLSINLGTNPFTTVNGSNVITVSQSSHGFFVGRGVKFSNVSTFNGITISNSTYYKVSEIVNTNSYKIVHNNNATASGSGGGSTAKVNPQRADYSVFNVDEGRAEKIRVALEVNGVVGFWSDVMSVPQVVTPPQPLSDKWVYVSRRPYGSYYTGDYVPISNPYVGSEGKQFEHCVAWNSNRSPASGDEDIVACGQDDNAITLSTDGGKTWAPPLSFGLWGAGSTPGIYIETDCFGNSNNKLMLAVVGYAWFDGNPGMYISKDLGKTWRRIHILDGDRVRYSKQANFARTNQNWLARRPQVTTGNLLSDADRPFFALEIAKAGGNTGGITTVALLRNKGATSFEDLANPSNWKEIGNWPVSGTNSVVKHGTTMDSTTEAWLGVVVATNGDVVVHGVAGAQLSTNACTAAAPSDVSFTEIYDGWVTGFQFDLTKGANDVSGAYLSVYSQGTGTDYGVYKTPNVRTTGFTRPSHHGIPENAGVNTLKVSPVNFDKVYCTTITKNGPVGAGSKGYYSSTGGVGSSSTNLGFNPCSVIVPTGYTNNENKWKYQWNDRPAGLYPHTTKGNYVLGMMQGGAWTISTNSGATMDGSLSGFMDHSHTKGWSYNPNDPDKFGAMQQDGGPVINYKGHTYAEYTGVGAKQPAKNQAGQTKTIYAWCQATVGGTESRTGGKILACIPGNSNRYVAGFAADGGHSKNLPVIFDTDPKSGEHQGDIYIRTDVGSSRGAKFFVHPNYKLDGTGTNVIAAGKWFISNWSANPPTNMNFTSYDDREILGWSKETDNNNVTTINWIFGGEGNNTSSIFKSTNASGSGPTNWKGLGGSCYNTAIAVNPFQHNMVYFGYDNGDGKIRRITSSASVVVADLKPLILAKFAAQGISTTGIPSLYPSFVVADLNVEGLIYVYINAQGAGGIWRIRNAHSSDLDDVIIEDITLNSVYGSTVILNVHPMTGELIQSGSLGEWWLPAPSWYPNITYKNRHTTWMNNFYSRSDIPDPPTRVPL